jgi:hypothetical protein
VEWDTLCIHRSALLSPPALQHISLRVYAYLTTPALSDHSLISFSRFALPILCQTDYQRPSGFANGAMTPISPPHGVSASAGQGTSGSNERTAPEQVGAVPLQFPSRDYSSVIDVNSTTSIKI